MNESFSETLSRQQDLAEELRLAPLSLRRSHLDALQEGIQRHTPALLEALRADLGKPPEEAWTSEVGLVLRDIRHARRNLGRWARPCRVRSPLILQPASARIVPQPLGVVLIIGPWNYPFQLLFAPLVSAIAAGNTACLKPSEFAPHCAQAVDALCADVFDSDHVRVQNGDHHISAALCDLPFDHIFFTGSTATGRKVAQAAAANLVPVTLELGGKSPCVIAPDAPLQTTVRRILWGKFLNAGQTCIAPDYLLLPQSRQTELEKEMVRQTSQWPAVGSRIVNRFHFERLRALLADTDILCGGACDERTLTIKPALVRLESDEHPLMKEEIFGPVAPLLTYSDDEDAMARIRRRPPPLALYLFTHDRRRIETYRKRIQCGGVCVNDTIAHVLPADLPFGGVGASGQGRYHGRHGFYNFSHMQAVLRRNLWPDLSMRYPPYRIPLKHLRRAYQLLSR